jgi:hypothetical protein
LGGDLLRRSRAFDVFRGELETRADRVLVLQRANVARGRVNENGFVLYGGIINNGATYQKGKQKDDPVDFFYFHNNLRLEKTLRYTCIPCF